jgi:hypothetical protein
MLLGTEHPLVRNCLNCGKVLCAQEGNGPCTFCGDNPKDKRKGGGGDQSGINTSTSFEKAVEQKNKLLEYDRNAAKRTVVYGRDTTTRLPLSC